MRFEFLEAALVVALGKTVLCDLSQLRDFCTSAVTEMSPEEFKFLDSLSTDALVDWVLETVPAHWRS